jgi:hypothetical protein
MSASYAGPADRGGTFAEHRRFGKGHREGIRAGLRSVTERAWDEGGGIVAASKPFSKLFQISAGFRQGFPKKAFGRFVGFQRVTRS